jgi:type I restriction enzyme S subunit
MYLERYSANTNGVLGDICEYSKEKIEVVKISLQAYYSTENMLPNKMGAEKASALPSTEKVSKCNAGDVLISNIRPYFKKIVYCQREAGCSPDVLCFTTKQNGMSEYMYSTLHTDKFFEYMVAGSKGTKMPRGDKQQILKYPIYVPKADEIKDFSQMAENALCLIEKNRKENDRLAGIRDSLLPKLMSGELDISELDV